MTTTQKAYPVAPFEKVTIINRDGTSITAESDNPIIVKALADQEGGYSVFRRWTVRTQGPASATYSNRICTVCDDRIRVGLTNGSPIPAVAGFVCEQCIIISGYGPQATEFIVKGDGFRVRRLGMAPDNQGVEVPWYQTEWDCHPGVSVRTLNWQEAERWGRYHLAHGECGKEGEDEVNVSPAHDPFAWQGGQGTYGV